jgi:stress-induced morphogen
MIYRALGELMAGPVHALALTTYTPEAWSKRGKSLL